jgi:hypothetical protein
MDFLIEEERIYATDCDGKVTAEITFPTKDGVATIDHTFVDTSLRGQGIASKLVKTAADKILADGHQIAATCSYAVTWFERHPAYKLTDTGAPIACQIGKRH